VRRKFRLTRPEDFQRVRQSGKSYAHPLMVLVAQAAETETLRVGVAASRSVGIAVKRNRAKRLMREAVRTLIPSLEPGWDLLLIARPAMAASDLFQVRAALLGLLRRAGLIRPSDGV
jgi:ribonuclease P protein component